MWRYLAGAVAGVLMLAAGWLLFNGDARSDPVLPAVSTAAAMPQESGGSAPSDALAVTLPAAPARSREQKRFDRYDKDRNAAITRAEYLAPRQKAFAKLDKNGDGRLSFEEWAVRTTTRFADADRDRSGTLTGAEFATTAPKRRARPACACPTPPSRDDD